MTFAAYLRSFRSTWGALSATATAGPIALFAGHLSPPWPTEDGSTATAFAVATSMVAITIAFLSDDPPERKHKVAVRVLLFSLVAILAFAACWSLTYVSIPQPVGDAVLLRRYVVGFWVDPEYQPLIQGQSLSDAVMKFGLQPWSQLSLMTARVILLGAMMLTFASLAYGFGLLQTTLVDEGRGTDDSAS